MTTTVPPIARYDRADAGVFVKIDLTVTASGDPVDADVQFALIAANLRPGESDWFDAVDNPDVEAGGIGLYLQPVADASTDGVWVKVTKDTATEILPPSYVGWIKRS